MSQNRQERNRVFRAIEGGDFDDFFPTGKRNVTRSH